MMRGLGIMFGILIALVGLLMLAAGAPEFLVPIVMLGMGAGLIYLAARPRPN